MKERPPFILPPTKTAPGEKDDDSPRPEKPRPPRREEKTGPRDPVAEAHKPDPDRKPYKEQTDKTMTPEFVGPLPPPAPDEPMPPVRPQSDGSIVEMPDEASPEAVEKRGKEEARKADDEAPELVPEHLVRPRRIKGARTFGKYRLLMEMGEGGMATLFLARLRGPEKFRKLVAIKKIHDHLTRKSEFIKMFVDEARIAALIHHPNVVNIFDLGTARDSYFIAMEYVHGQSLVEAIRTSAKAGKHLPWTHAARIVADAASGLHAAHELHSDTGEPLNVVHRDVSPQNILISYDGHVKMADFGIAYAAEKLTHTDVGTLKGKASYMSPEQTRGEPLDRRSDIFALGTVLYESVCARRLFKRPNQAATLISVRDDDVDPLPRKVRKDIPAELEQIILKALAKDPGERFETARDMAAALEKLLVAEGAAVGPQQIGEMMEQLFQEKRKLKDSQISTAVLEASAMALPALDDSEDTGSVSDYESVRKSKWKTPLLVAFGILGGAVVVAALVSLILWPRFRPAPEQKKTEPAAAPGPAPRPRAGTPRPAPVETVTLAVVVTPDVPGTEIKFRGKTYKRNSLKLVVPRTAKSEDITVTAPDHQTEQVVVTPVADKKLSITLKPLESRPSQPEARPEDPKDDKKVEKSSKRKRRKRRRRRRKRKRRTRLLRGI